ncbi:MAG: SLBB domain-containing protein [Treponema sp.]|nr:SLBB domain-containing protein [Treponema sp.]
MDGTLTARIREAGVVGAGGAGFPTSVKLDSKPEFIIINGVECEPLIQADQQIAAVHAASLLETLDGLVKTLGAKGGIFAVKKKYTAALEALSACVGKYPALAVKALNSSYPMGDEHVLVYEALGRIVPEGGIPLNVGALVLNTETLLNIRRALDGLPVTDKYVTVAGAVKKPATFMVPLGLPYSALIQAAGGATIKSPVLIDGGPMMGRIQRNLDAPVTKTSSAIIVLPGDHPAVRSHDYPIDKMLNLSKAACCHCSLCSDVCPRSLLGHSLFPDKLMRLAAYNSTCENEFPATTAYLCCECRLCEYACIMGLQPWRLNQELKRRLKKAGIKNPCHNAPEKASDFREYRMYPTDKLVRQLGLSEYNHIAAPLTEYTWPVDAVYLPLKQHFGASALAKTAPGDRVKKGDRIAAMEEGALGADLHASIDGKIRSVDANLIVIERE